MAAGAAGRFKRDAAHVVWGRALDVPAKASSTPSLHNPFTLSVKRLQLVVTVSPCMTISF